jgi:hypothetical protein
MTTSNNNAQPFQQHNTVPRPHLTRAKSDKDRAELMESAARVAFSQYGSNNSQTTTTTSVKYVNMF